MVCTNSPYLSIRPYTDCIIHMLSSIYSHRIFLCLNWCFWFGAIFVLSQIRYLYYNNYYWKYHMIHNWTPRMTTYGYEWLRTFNLIAVYIAKFGSRGSFSSEENMWYYYTFYIVFVVGLPVTLSRSGLTPFLITFIPTCLMQVCQYQTKYTHHPIIWSDLVINHMMNVIYDYICDTKQNHDCVGWSLHVRFIDNIH